MSQSLHRWITPPPVYDSHSHSVPTTSLKPYLELPYLLSLTWLAYPILSLLFVAFRLQISSASAQDSLSTAKADLLASCKAAETAATATASMPRYLAEVSNQQFVDAVNATMNSAREALVLSLTVMEAVINFLIDIYRSTFFCFLELIVRGTLSVLISAVQEISTFITSTLSTLRTTIQNDVNSVNSAIQTAINGINKVNPFSPITAPQFSIPSLNSLQNVTIPTDFENSLIQLNNSLPSITDLKNSLAALIDTPFELVKKDINDTFLGISFNSSILAVPQQNTVSFCNSVDTSVVDNLGNDLLKVTKIGIIIIIVTIILLLAYHCFLEWYKWRCLQQHLEYTRQAWTTDPTVYHSAPVQKMETPSLQMTNYNLLSLQGMTAHPFLMRLANQLSALFHLSRNQNIHLQWFFHYVFHPPAMACLMIGVFGLISVELQMLAIQPLATKFSGQTASSVAGFSNTIATAVNSSMYNQSASYANQVNTHIDVIQTTINDGVFGWVNSTTTTLNSTLVNFYTEVQSLVNTVFGNTILATPMQDFVKCIIGTKVQSLEQALTFLHNNLNVNMPRMNDSILVLSPASVNEATQPIALAAVGSGTNGSGGVVGRIINVYVASLQKERVMFSIFIGLWGIVVLMALAIIFWHSYAKAWVEAYRKRRWHREQREGLGQFSASHAASSIDIANEKGQVDLPSFSPMPSPKPGFLGTLTSPMRRVGSLQGSSSPLRSMNPNFEKSWDSFIDASSKETTTQQKRSKRLLSFGNKSTGEEHEVPDVPSEGRQTRSGWLERVAGLIRKKDDHITPPTPFPFPRRSPRPKPQLTISTNHVKKGLPIIEKESSSEDNNGLSSAWSVSPGVSREVPWTEKYLPVKNNPKVAPQLTKHRAEPSEAQAPSHLALPLHHGFQHPVPPDHPRQTSPPSIHVKGTSPSAIIPKQSHLAAPPVHPTRKPPCDFIPAQPRMNPFATPFDDEYVSNDNPFASPTNKVSHASVRQSAGTNPFAPLVI